MIEPQEGAYWLALLSGKQIRRELAKRVIYHWCLEYSERLSSLFALDPEALAECCDLQQREAEQILAARVAVPDHVAQLEALASQGVHLLTRADVPYPDVLVERLPEERLPYYLFYAGELGNLTQPGLTIWGAREPAAEAQAIATELAEALAQAEQHLVGGYERGVDRQALDAAREVGGRVTLFLPLGMQPFGGTLARMADVRRGGTLVLSPYPPETAYSSRLAAARLPLLAALSEVLYLIAPDDAPPVWPWLVDYVRWGGRLYLWRGAEGDMAAQWLEAGAEPFNDAQDGRAQALRLLGATEEELGVSEIPLEEPDEEELDFALYGSADEALDVLRRSGRVPDGLARRLREREAHIRRQEDDI